MFFFCLILHNFYGLAFSSSLPSTDERVEELRAEEKTLKDLQSKVVLDLLRLREELKDEKIIDNLMSDYTL